MNGVLGMARLLAETRLDQEQQALLSTIVESAEALLTVLNDLLDLSRLTSGRFELRSAAFDPRSVAERACAPFHQKAAGKRLALELAVEPGLPALVQGDPGRIRQILVNLLGNALKFTDEGSVRLILRPDRLAGTSAMAFDVIDTGRGFHLDELSRSGTPAGPERATRVMFGGTGLGLAISRALAQAMGGRLELSSELGSGTWATLLLPAVAAEAAPSELQPISLAGLNLLVVLPQAELRERVRRAAAGWGMAVRGAASLDDALREVQEARTRSVAFDLAALDAALAERDVRLLLDTLRSEAGGVVRAVSVAGSGLRGDAARAGDLGLDGYLTAPFVDDDLMQILIRIMQQHENVRLWTRHDVEDDLARGLRILVADDNPVNCRLARLLLEKAGHEVTTVADGVQAVGAVAEQAFDLVLMDVQMPNMDGLAATTAIRRLPQAERKAVPVVALTADAMAGDEQRIQAAGMDGYLTKPIDRPKLLSTVQFWGARRRHAVCAYPSSRAG